MKLNKKGFTLVELLAVIVVLAIIGLIGFTSMNAVFDSTRKSTAAANAAQFESAAKTYCQTEMSANGGEMPTSASFSAIPYDFNGAVIKDPGRITFSDDCKKVQFDEEPDASNLVITIGNNTFSCKQTNMTGKWKCE